MRTLFLLLNLFLLPLLLSAQTYVHSGCVTDEEGDPVSFVHITGKVDPAISVYTNIDGSYEVTSKGRELELVFTLQGYETKTVDSRAGNTLAVQLKKGRAASESGEGTLLEEVAVSAAGVTRKRRASKTPLSPRPAAAMDMAIMSSPAPVARMSYSMEAESASVPVASRERRPVSGEMADSGQLPAAGQLTAGEVNDFGKWDLWNDISKEDLAAFRDVWGFYPEDRFGIQLTHPGGSPAVNISVELVANSDEVIWSARTDNHGRAELWRGMFVKDRDRQARLILRVNVNGRSYNLPSAHSIQDGINAFELPIACQSSKAVDVAFVVDATGSMGDEIRYLSSELQDVMRRAADSLAGQDVRLASVFYRDHGDSYLTRQIDFKSGLDKVVQFVGEQGADGGGDTPEAVDDALAVALNKLKWREEAASRLLFLVLDAPPHDSEEHSKRMREITRKAAEKGVRIIPVVCSGMQQSGEYLLRSMALATNGTYTFLTDHSGIGGKHLEPSTDSYEVEKLNDLLVRVIHQFGKVADCTATEVLSLPTRIPVDQVNSIDWDVFPNPTAGATNLTFPATTGEVFLLDTNGKILRRYEVISERQTIELGDLPSGPYFLRYEAEGKVSTRRILVNRA